MSLFTKLPTVILYIQPHSIDFIFFKGGQVLHLDIPTTIMNNLEIYDQLGFEKLLATFIKDNNIKKQESAILLSEHLVFEKRFPKTESVTVEAVQNFIDKVPLKPTEIAKKHIQLPEETVILVVNHDIFNVLINVLTKHQWTVRTVLPMQVAPSLLGSNQINLPVIKSVLNNNTQIAKYNLLEPVISVEAQSSGINKSWIIGAAILILGVIGFVILESTGMFTLPSGIQPSPTATPVSLTPTLTPTPTASIDKSEYEITVLNGSGIAGEARLVQEQLEAEEFVVVRTGNAETSEFTRTIISSKKDIPEVFIDELRKAMGETYILEEEIEILPEDSDEDIVITIGQEKKE